MSTLKRAVAKKKKKILRESEDFAGNPETWEIRNKAKFSEILSFFLEMCPKISGRCSRFPERLLFTLVLLKQHLLKLSPTLFTQNLLSKREVISFNSQAVTRVRKRITSMILTVSVIFGICWGMDQVVYSLKFTASYNIGPVPIAIANTMVLFNAAVNPFVYALLNQKFKEKMKRMICCTGCSIPIAHPTQEPQNIELTNSTTHPSHPATTSQE